MDRLPRPPDQYHPPQLPRPPHLHPPPSPAPTATVQPPIPLQHTAHLPPSHRTLPTPHPIGPGQQYPPQPPPPPPPPPNAYGTPLSLPNVKAERNQDHAYPSDSPAHTTPVARHAAEFPPPQIPSAPMQPTNGPPMHHGDRPVDGPMHPYHPPPTHDAHSHHYAQPPPHIMQEQHHMGQPMAEHAAYVHPAQYHPGAYVYAGSPYGPRQRKSARAAQACEKCRERKSKCDENRPCLSCKEQGLDCYFRDGPPAKADKSSAGAVHDALNDIKSAIEGLGARMSDLEQSMGRPKVELKHVPVSSRRDTPAQAEQTDEESVALEEFDQKPVTTDAAPSDSDSIDDTTASFEEHTTAAHKLIDLWPSINKLLGGHKPPTNYVTEKEARGPLRLYGQGEADESGYNGAFGAESPAYSHGSEDTSPPTPPDTWGTGQVVQEGRRSEPHAVGGMGTDGKIDLEAATVSRLFENYRRHIHKMHPFLDLGSLTHFIQRFIRHHCSGRHTGFSPLVRNGALESKSNKRKRSEPGVHTVAESSGHGPKSAPDRSLSNAIVYLVLALGKVCEHKDPLPGTVQEDGKMMAPPMPASSFGTHAASPATTKPSPASSHGSTVTSTPPPGGETYRSGGKSPRSFDGSTATMHKKSLNVEKIPGLFYYREACSILGDFQDSNELGAAQARLLAGLYKGQLARVQESWSWITDAARTCRYRIKLEGLDKKDPKTPSTNPRSSKEERTENILLLVSWSALQLESDILAELDYPHSGLLALESKLCYPSNVISEDNLPFMDAEDAEKKNIDFYYSAQLFLRRRLNRMHAALYGQALWKQTPQILVEILETNYSNLEGWRSITSQFSRWKDSELPSTDILAARLRAKYYGARYIATRPYLDYALHVMEKTRDGRVRLEDVAIDANGYRRASTLALFRAIATMPESYIRQMASICVESAKLSTVALDRAGADRLIVTNIMGTAHAQFGNMLVLSATYMSNIDWLTKLIPQEDIRALLDRTIEFLRRLRYISKTAMVDIEILQAIGRYMFGATFKSFSSSEPASVTASFCADTS